MSTPHSEAYQIGADLRKLARANNERLARGRRALADGTAVRSALELKAAMESIMDQGLVNDATAVLMHMQMQTLGVPVSQAALESASSPEAYVSAGLEGLGHWIDRARDRFNQWNDRRKLDTESYTGALLESAIRLRGLIGSVQQALSHYDDKQTVEVDMSSLRGYLGESEGTWPTDCLQLVMQSLIDMPKFQSTMVTTSQNMTLLGNALFEKLDITSDKAIQQTWLSKAPAMARYFVKKLPPGVELCVDAEYELLTNGADVAWRRYIGGEYYDKGVVNAPIYNLGSYFKTPVKGDKVQSVTVGRVKEMLKLAAGAISKFQDKAYIRRCNQISDAAEELFVKLYLIETGRRTGSPKHVSGLSKPMIPGSLQAGLGPLYTYQGRGIFTTVYSVTAAAHAAAQIARRTVTALKHSK